MRSGEERSTDDDNSEYTEPHDSRPDPGYDKEDGGEDRERSGAELR